MEDFVVAPMAFPKPALKGATSMIIDAWMQHPNANFIQDPVFDSLRRWRPSVWSKGNHSIEATLTEMDNAGVTCGMLCAWWGPSGVMISNDEVAQHCRSHPGRFIGIASVDLYRPMEGVRELRKRVKQDGFKGLRIVPWLWGLPPDDRRYYPLFAECCELDIPFCTQVGHSGPLRESEPGRPIPYLDRVALEFPELRIVGGHIGVPWLDEMLALVMKYPNVFIDTSAYKVSRYPKDLVDYMRGSKTHKVLFGSNHPFWPPGDCIAGLDNLGLSDNAQTLFLSKNAERVFKIG
jgi:predicted TIM-barrel fold metal-dependent hydrolase